MRPDQVSNPEPLALESDALATTLPAWHMKWKSVIYHRKSAILLDMQKPF